VLRDAALSGVSDGPFAHEALYYRDTGEFLDGTVTFVRGGLDAGGPVLVAVPQPRLGLLQEAVADADGRVRFVNMAEAGRNPNRILPCVLRAFANEHRSQRVWIIGEPIYVGRAPEEITPAVQHEALINVAFEGADVAILCPYDVAELAGVVPYAECTHPVVVDHRGRRSSSAYTDPYAVVATLNRPLPEPHRVDDTIEFDARGLVGMRRLVGRHAMAVGLGPDDIADLQLATTEIATNALIHAGADLATLRLWAEPDRIVCEIRGAGEIHDVMAGRAPAPPESARGRGLLVANLLCDLVQTYTVSTGTVTRLHMRL
jgi:anti-sigma regulatory factor (Ser/Thr protein kinase)